MVSARSGENVVKTLYKTAGEVAGIPLTEYELAFHDKILTVTAGKSSEDEEGRTPYADQIEAEDLALEAAKNRKKRACVVM